MDGATDGNLIKQESQKERYHRTKSGCTQFVGVGVVGVVHINYIYKEVLKKLPGLGLVYYPYACSQDNLTSILFHYEFAGIHQWQEN